MLLQNAGAVIADTNGTGSAGSIFITAGNLTIDGQLSMISSSSSNFYTNIAGNAGSIHINVSGTMQVLNGGEVTSITRTQGNAGKIFVTARNLVIDNHQNSIVATGIISTAESESTGNAGSININVSGTILLVKGGIISTATHGLGNAGTIAITAGSLIIDGQESEYYTGIFSNANPGSPGDASTITIAVASILKITEGDIFTSAQTGVGGNIIINAPAIVLNNSQITTSVTGAGGNGGDITLNGNYLVLDTGFIQANTVGENAKGGNIFINMDGVLPNGGVTIVGGEHRDFIPHSCQNVIQAAANATENDGTITITNPSDSSAAGITGAANRLEPMQIAKNPCIGIKKRASLRRKGRGALLKSSLKSDLLKTNDYAPNSKDVTHTNRKQRQQEVCAEG